MTYFTVDKIRFATITDSMINALMEIPVETFTVSKSSIEAFKDMLNLSEETSNEDLQAIRNGVVFAFSTKSSILREEQNPRYWDVQKTMSAITAVIDDMKWKRGMAV